MKKKIMLCLVMGCLTAALWGCKAEEPAEEAVSGTAEEEAVEIPKLGQEDIEEYTGFPHLKPDTITAESRVGAKEGETVSKDVTVFVPGEPIEMGPVDAAGEVAGVNVLISVEEYYIMENCTLEEDLQNYLTVAFDPTYINDVKDAEISEIEKAGDNAALAHAEFIRHDVATDTDIPNTASYYVVTLENGVTLMVIVTVDESEVTEETAAVIEELETFYSFDITWEP